MNFIGNGRNETVKECSSRDEVTSQQSLTDMKETTRTRTRTTTTEEEDQE
jgi:hypothetical protein